MLVHEATFMTEQSDRAVAAGHSTAAEAATVARDAGVKTLILTHISARYESDSVPHNTLGDLLAEAQAIFPNTLLAHDFWSYVFALLVSEVSAPLARPLTPPPKSGIIV